MEGRVDILVREHRGGAVIAVSGEAGPAAADRLRDELMVWESLSRLVIDLSGLRSIERTATRAMLDAQVLLIADGGTMAVACPQPPVVEVLAETGADQFIPVYDTVRKALVGPYELLKLY